MHPALLPLHPRLIAGSVARLCVSLVCAVAVVWYTFVLEAVLRLGRVAWYHRTPWVSGFRDAAGASI